MINEHLSLRLPHQKDWEELLELVLANRAHLQKEMHWVTDDYGPTDAQNGIQRGLQAYADQKGLKLFIVYDTKIIWIISLMGIDKENRNAEVGYWIGEQYQGKGLMTLALQAIIDIAFKELKLVRLGLRVSDRNIGSARVAEKCGFTYEWLIKKDYLLKWVFEDSLLYGLINPHLSF
jgi:ribosomal-protein-serine acetyltransferase